MSASSVWLELRQIEGRLCVLTVEHTGTDFDEINRDSRFIEDLNCDSLDLIELMMEIEDEFNVTIPDKPTTPVAKQIFTRQPFRVRDLAEFIFLNQGTVSNTQRNPRKRAIQRSPATESGFTHLGGKLRLNDLPPGELYRPLDHDGKFPMFRRGTDGMLCVQVTGASTTIGSDDQNAHNDQKPRHIVTLSSFLIDVDPVSVTAFCRFLNSIDIEARELETLITLDSSDGRRSDMQFGVSGSGWSPKPDAAMQPVVMVSWQAANAYSRWANARDWRNGECPRSYLPTEAQWEYAAAGAFDDSEHVVAGLHKRGETYQQEGLPIPNVQQAYGQSRFGLRHMSGTIWHWCRDWFSPDFYSCPAATALDAFNETESGVRSERGGSWVGPIELCRPSYRRGRNPNARGRCLGFRCVGDPPNKKNR